MAARQFRAKRRHYAVQQSMGILAYGAEFSPGVGVGCKAWTQSRHSQPPCLLFFPARRIGGDRGD